MRTEKPLLLTIEERDREDLTRRRMTAERCETVERALRAVGFAPGTSYWSVAMLIARVSDGWRPLVRSLDEIAADRAIATRSKDPANRKRIVRRAIDELASWGIVSVETSDGSPRRRTRPEVIYRIELNRPAIVAEAAGMPTLAPPRDADNGRTTAGQCEGQRSGQSDGQRGGQIENDSLSIPLDPFSPNPSPPAIEQPATAAEALGSDWGSVVDALRDAGVERVRAAIAEAIKQRLSPAELAEAAFVVTNTPALSGGALFDWIRNGAWPIGGVRTAAEIRRSRRERAEAIRTKTRSEAPPNAAGAIVGAVTAKRLRAAGLETEATPAELAAFAELEKRKTEVQNR